MNKKELIERLEGLKNIFGNKGEYIEIDAAIKLIEQLDEPQKTVVPQFIADYIKYTKEAEWDLLEAMDEVAYEDNKDLRKWFNNNIETFARAWLDGFEIEKEKKYRVSMPKTRNYKNHEQTLCEKDSKIFWCGEWCKFKTKFTRKELEEAGFGWVFNCEGVEIEEVEE